MTDPRWTIVRRLLLVFLVGTGIAVAARRARPPAEPGVTPDDAVEGEASAEPAGPPTLPAAGPLFDGALPIALTAIPAGLPGLSAQGCNACHFSVHDAWAAGAHARAWTSERFRLALDRAGDTTACTGCHLPLQRQHARLASGYTDGDIARPELADNPAWDPTLMTEGVTCAACHVRDGKVLTTRADASPSAHPLALSEDLDTSELCATCHQLTWPDAAQPFYDTYGEWQRSPQGQAGIGCQDCHMPPVAGLATATRFAAQADHGVVADTARALTVLARLSAPEVERGTPIHLTLTLRNTGAGHSVPTGSPFKSYRVVARLIGADGKELTAPFTHDLAREVQPAPPWETLSDNRLPAGGELVLDHDFTVDQRKRAGRGLLEIGIWRLDSEQRADTRWTPARADPPLLRQEIPLVVM